MIENKKSTGILIFNEAGQLALQLRAARDDSFPSHWDFSAGGGIDQNENESVAARREVHEELGVDAEVEFLQCKKFTYPAWKPNVTRHAELWIYKASHNGPFNIDSDEVQKITFFTREQIEDLIASGDKIHPEFLIPWNEGVILEVMEKQRGKF